MGKRAIIIAAPSSGSGKTTITLSILRALRRQGIRVASCKVGPDYIDSAFHTTASGIPCRNVDPSAMRPETLRQQIADAAADAEFVVIEGVMGLFDGNLTADVAELLGLRVILVLDVAGQIESAAAVAKGFATFRADVEIAGVILNNVGSPRHAQLIRSAFEIVGIPIVGVVPRRNDLVLPSRHLGLVQAREHADIESFLNQAAVMCGECINLAQIMDIATPIATAPVTSRTIPVAPLGQRIAVARDEAFAFCYPHILDGWRDDGAELTFFSPLANQGPIDGVDAVYLPGGYPELHAGRLSANSVFLSALRDAAAQGTAIYGECGGYMVLGESLTDAAGVMHPMLGLLPVHSSIAERRLHLGYRVATLYDSGPLGAAGSSVSTHEFHYATAVERPEESSPLFRITDPDGAMRTMGLARGRVCGSFLHLIDRVAAPQGFEPR
jgi:cobyrinic acid a,c-diamide synthase